MDYFLRTAQRMAAPPTTTMRTSEATSRFLYLERLVFSASDRSLYVGGARRAFSGAAWRIGGVHNARQSRRARNALLIGAIYTTKRSFSAQEAQRFPDRPTGVALYPILRTTVAPQRGQRVSSLPARW